MYLKKYILKSNPNHISKHMHSVFDIVIYSVLQKYFFLKCIKIFLKKLFFYFNIRTLKLLKNILI
jgi:hypothetical protein